MSSPSYRCLNIFTLMKGGIVHDNNTAGWTFRQQCLSDPGVKNIRVNGALPELYTKKLKIKNCANGIDSASGMPITFTRAALTSGGIAMSSGSIQGEPTFIYVDNTITGLLISVESFLKGCPVEFIGFWVM